MLHVQNMDLDAVEQGCHIKNSDMYKYTFHEFQCREKICQSCNPLPSINKQRQHKHSTMIVQSTAAIIVDCQTPHITELCVLIDYPSSNSMQSQNYKSSLIGKSHAIPELHIMPNPMHMIKTYTVPVPTLPPFAPDSDSPSRTTCVEG